MIYAEALEQQVRALRLSEDPQFVRTWLRNWSEGGVNQGMWDSYRWAQARSEPVYVGPEISEMLGRVALGEMPPWTLTDDSLLVRRGFCWFATNPGYHDATGDPAELVALSWFPQWISYERRGDELVLRTSPFEPPEGHVNVRGPVLVLLPWYTSGVPPVRAATGPWSAIIMSFGQVSYGSRGTDAAGQPVLPADEDDVRFVTKLFASLMLFSQQHLLTAAPERPDRASRRRLQAQGWTHDPLIRVVKLRAREHVAQGVGEGESAAVDWSCRWVVRGHWRAQFFPSTQEHRPIWIMPHIKGPEDKPLKPPGATVFAVVR